MATFYGEWRSTSGATTQYKVPNSGVTGVSTSGSSSLRQDEQTRMFAYTPHIRAETGDSTTARPLARRFSGHVRVPTTPVIGPKNMRKHAKTGR